MIEGFALLGSHLGDPDRKILTPTQIRNLTRRMRTLPAPEQQRELTEADLRGLGYGGEMAARILSLLSEKEQLSAYLQQAVREGCSLLTRGEPDYPLSVRKRLGGESPCCLFLKGNRRLLQQPAAALVGSRELQQENRAFAREAGRQAAAQDLVLVSGNARGADRTAQEACLEAGGSVISVVADGLSDKCPDSHLLYISQEDFDAPFSALRALSRNRLIHTLGILTLVAQCSLGTGGTWSGTIKNLQHGWTPVLCFRDGSQGAEELQRLGAYGIGLPELGKLSAFREPQLDFWNLQSQN